MGAVDNTETVDQLNRMIDNVKNGVNNNSQTVLESQPENTQVGQPVGQENQQNVELIGSDPTQNPVNTTTPPPVPNN